MLCLSGPCSPVLTMTTDKSQTRHTTGRAGAPAAAAAVPINNMAAGIPNLLTIFLRETLSGEQNQGKEHLRPSSKYNVFKNISLGRGDSHI